MSAGYRHMLAEVGESPMCRYSMHPAKTHYACIPCRSTVKFPRHRGAICPRCDANMVDLGRDFKAPRRGDVSQWRKVEMLVDAGIRFDSCGCSGPGYRPRTLSDAKSEMRLRRADRKVTVPRRKPAPHSYHGDKYHNQFIRQLGT